MTLTLDLTPEEHEALRRRAEADGTDSAAVLRGFIASLMPPPIPPLGAAPDGPPIDPEEQAERDRERAEIQANLDRWRAEQRGESR